MITIARALRERIREVPFLEEGLAQGVINMSGLARFLKPSVEARLYKKVSVGSLVMALKRLRPAASRRRQESTNQLKSLRNLSVQSNLVEYAFPNSSQIFALQVQLLKEAVKRKDLFLNFSHGVSETTLIVNEEFSKQVERLVPKSLRIDKIPHLTAITIKLRPEHVHVPGILYSLLKALAWERVNIIEAISSYTEITIIVEDKLADRAFSIIRAITS